MVVLAGSSLCKNIKTTLVSSVCKLLSNVSQELKSR